MKLPENFNAGATKKASTSDKLAAAISGNFTASENTSAASAENSAVTVKIQETQQAAVKTQSVQVPAAAVQQTAETSEKTVTKEKKESFLISMSQGERSLYKSLCALQNVSMNHFVICAMDYFKEELENGKVSISKHGYKRV